MPKKIILILIIMIGLILPGLLIVQPFQLEAEQLSELPETPEELKTFGRKILDFFPQILAAIRQSWREQVMSIWQKIYQWIIDLWNNYILPWFQNVWQKIKNFFQREIEERRPGIEQELQKEKQQLKEALREELKEETPKIRKGIWERFKELIK